MLVKAKKKKTTSANEFHADLLKSLYEHFEQNRQAFDEFIKSNQHLSRLEKAEAWLKYVSENIADYSNQEAVIYLISRGYDCSPQVSTIISLWRIAASETIKSASSAKYIYNVGGGKKLISKAITNSNKVSDFSTTNLQDFWNGRDGEEETIDATMLRTVEWCEIGGFDDWWIRLSQDIKKDVLHGGLENTVPSTLSGVN